MGRPSVWAPRPSGLNFLFCPFGLFLSHVLQLFGPGSVDLKVNGFPEGNVPNDTAKSVDDYFVDQNIKVLAIQQCPNKVARVTFEDRTACELICLRGELDMNGVKVLWFLPHLPLLIG